MDRNIGFFARMFRFICGVVVGIWVVAGGAYWGAFLSIYLLGTAAWGFSPLKAFLNSHR